jgi:type IV pilus assembly protein PilE
MRPYAAQRGFTLIELMIVVAIIGILAAIAIPNYNEHITKARITEAVAKLSDMRVRMEQFFQDNRTYVGACQAGTLAPLPANTDYFQYSCPAANLTATTFTVTATGIGKMNTFVYTINQNNVRATTGTSWGVTSTSCWVLTKAGGC